MPDLATILRLMTISAWLEGFLACRGHAVPDAGVAGFWARVICRSYQSESAAKGIVSEGQALRRARCPAGEC
ncbi:MAG: hypothetical protein R3C56_19305 [Pirellulaceae bacterium]